MPCKGIKSTTVFVCTFFFKPSYKKVKFLKMLQTVYKKNFTKLKKKKLRSCGE